MRAALAILLGIHGLIHLLGFLKAFDLGQFPLLTGNTSRIHGLLWLLTAILILLAMVLFLTNKDIWPWIGLAGLILSQFLIVITWADAKHGTWINILLLLVFLVAIGKSNFNTGVQQEVRQLYSTQRANAELLIAGNKSATLPVIVQNWIENSGISAIGPIEKVHLNQRGMMRTEPDGKWMPFSAEQWFNIPEPGFVWKTKVEMVGPVFLTGRDKLINGEGSMNISLLSLIPVVSEGKDPKLDQGSRVRYLAEICWFPSAAMQPYLIWETLGVDRARATFRDQPDVSGIFQFDGQGRIISFEALRYRGSGDDAPMEKWVVRNTSFAEFNQVNIPNRSEVSWITEGGEFHWLSLEIIVIEYN